jgi:tellurite resistance protein TerC
MGADMATYYVTAYVVEEMLSVDNLFVFVVIMGYFCVPHQYQHKALFYGIIGAFVFRAIFLFLGMELLNSFEIMMYIFGAVLIFAAYRTVTDKDEPGKQNKLAVLLSKRFKVSPDYDGDKLFTWKNGVRMMTPMILCIIVIELTDVVFAVDSVPAVLAIRPDNPDLFIMSTSNMFAVLGLRSLFFVIKGTLEHLEYLKYGLGVILVFIAIRLLGYNYIDVPVVYSLAFVVSVLTITIAASLIVRRKKKAREKEDPG